MIEQILKGRDEPDDREVYHMLLDKYLDERQHQQDPNGTKIVQVVRCNYIWNKEVPVVRMTRLMLVVKAVKQEELHV